MGRGGYTPQIGVPVDYFRPDGGPPEYNMAGPFPLTPTAVNGTHVDGDVTGDGDPYPVTDVVPVAESALGMGHYQQPFGGIG